MWTLYQHPVSGIQHPEYQQVAYSNFHPNTHPFMHIRIAVTLFLLVIGCSANNKISAPIALDEPLPAAAPEVVGMDTVILNTIVQQLRAEDHKIHSMLVVRKGKLVVEEYFNGYDRNRPHDIRSATKSITSLLVGAAIDRGFIDGIEAPMMQYLASSYPDIKDKNQIQLKHLLMMQNGLDCDDGDRKTKGQEDRMYRSKDWISYFLALENVHVPGDSTRYCTGGVVALGEVVAQATGKDFGAFAGEVLFEPLDIKNYHWARFDGGEKVDSGGHLMITPQGMVKIGMLVLNEGRWGGQQLVASNWIAASTKPRTMMSGNPYGYLWWHNFIPYGEKQVEVISARGNGGQVIFIVPEYELVVVFTAGYYNSDKRQVVYDIFFRGLLPATDALKPHLQDR